MVLYRIVNCLYASDLSGAGARLYGGRWNSEGKQMLYLASSRALAVLEVLVHLPSTMIPEDYCLVEIEVPENGITQLLIEDLPPDWKDISHPVSLKKLGDEFLRKQMHLMMKIPSSIVPMEYNYLVNPLHQDMTKVKVLSKQPFDFDQRLSPL